MGHAFLDWIDGLDGSLERSKLKSTGWNTEPLAVGSYFVAGVNNEFVDSAECQASGESLQTGPKSSEVEGVSENG